MGRKTLGRFGLVLPAIQDIKNKIARARTSLVLDHPFFASLALRLEFQPDDECETAWTNGRILAYNPGYIEQLPLDELSGLCAHIVMHPVCGHHQRRHGRDPLLWNRACDYAINWILLDAGITLPQGYLNHRKYHNKNADEIYQLLVKCGEEASESDATYGDPGKAGEVRDASSDPNGNSQKQEPDWKTALAQASNHAKNLGDLSTSLDRLVTSILQPQINWQAALMRFIDSAANNDYSWLPPNRRHIHNDLYLPSMQNRELHELVIVIDSSGSLAENQLNMLAAELSAILELNPARINLLYCDAKVVGWKTITREDLPLEIEVKGGGGTDFRPAFEWVEAQQINPACLIYLTDMECTLFPQEPDYPVLWTRIGKGGVKPPFGELLNI